MLFQRACNPLRSRPRKCAISSFSDIFVAQCAPDLRRAIVLRPFGRRCGVSMCIGIRAIRNPIDASALRSRRYEIEAELLADNSCEEAADRMLLPSCGMDQRLDGRTARSSQHRNDASLLAIGAPRV